MRRLELQNLSQEDMQPFFRRIGSIVSSYGGRVEASSSQRKLAILFEDGTLLVDRSNPYHPQVLAFREIARRKGIPLSAWYATDIEAIRLLYEEADKLSASVNGTAADRRNTIPMQREVLQLLAEGAQAQISDIHIYVRDYEAEIKFRMGGDMVRIRQVSAEFGHELLAAAFNMADVADATYRIHDYQAARISRGKTDLPSGLQAVRLQFNPLGSSGRYLIARLLYAERRWETRLSLTSLGFHALHCKSFARMRQMPEGINIISGPTGSGKSTTLKIVLEELYKERGQQINILTIEDPPEYEITGAAQLPVTNVDTEEERGAAYRKAISAALRSDPDVIMPGEARDQAVINLVFTAAMTGHQVWTSLHANNAMAIFDRLRDQGVENYKLSDPKLLTGLTAQRLIKLLCPRCSTPLQEASPDALSRDLQTAIKRTSSAYKDAIRMVNRTGCKACSGGYAGRAVLAEVICPDQTFLDLMTQGGRAEAQRYWLDEMHGMTIMEHGWMRLVAGQVDPRDLLARVGPFGELDGARCETLAQMGLDGNDV
jgi:type II secretory ATPase GspE/PulE/Tfp pilus assembly ATPase PilB-like protein